MGMNFATNLAVNSGYSLTRAGKDVVIGEYSSSSAPSSAVAGQIWFKDATMTIDEARVLVLSATTSNLPTTINDARITADMEIIKQEVGNPSYVSGSLTYTVASGSVTITGTLTDSTTIRVWLLRSR